MRTCVWSRGLAWHDAGAPFSTDINFSAYWDMIIILYTSLGLFLFVASFDPPQFKPLLGWATWGANFCHGCVALVSVFEFKEADEKYPLVAGNSASPILGYAHLDKLFFAVPLWFVLFSANFYFAKQNFGSSLLPWCDIGAATPEGANDSPDTHPLMGFFKIWLKIQGFAYLTIFFLAYGIKWGLAWHDAGTPFSVPETKFSAYWNMIVILYTSLGAYLLAASKNPTGFKPLIGYTLWGANFCHGCVAFVSCFQFKDGKLYPGYDNPIGSGDGDWANMDKMFFVVPLWFTLFATNLFFVKRIFGTSLLPWKISQYLVVQAS